MAGADRGNEQPSPLGDGKLTSDHYESPKTLREKER